MRRVRIENIGYIQRTVSGIARLRPRMQRCRMCCDPKLETGAAVERDLENGELIHQVLLLWRWRA